MDKVEFLPLGSIVHLRGSVKKTMIIARALAIKLGNDMKYFDYGGCLYPEGLVGDQLLYFNHDSIMDVVNLGYHDGDDELMVKNLNEWVEKTPFERGDPYAMNQASQAGPGAGDEKGGGTA